MTCTPDEILSLAEDLAKSNTEHYLRASISSAYYSVYHHVESYLLEEYNESGSFLGGDGGSHQKLIHRMTHSSVLKEKGIGYILATMKKNRVKADYHLDTDIDSDEACSQIKSAKRAIEKLSS